MSRLLIIAVCGLVAVGVAMGQQDPPSIPEMEKPRDLQPKKLQDGLKKELADAYARAGDWLVAEQDKDGAWSQEPKPGMKVPSIAYTGLIVAAFADAPGDLKKKYAQAVEKGCAFMVGKQNKDGSFGEGPSGAFLKTYTTAIVVMALTLAGPEKYQDARRNASGYLKNNQVKEEGIDRGGSGYGDEEPKPDGTVKKGIANLSTTGFTAEALARSGLPQDDEYWKLVIEYVKRCQNSSEVNKDAAFIAKLKEKGLSIGDDGGLFYAANPDPAVHKAGTVKLADREVIVSYGSMTYHGIKTYIYAGLKKDSPEVKAAVDWVRKNWSVEAHPGMPYDEKKRNHLRGLFYYYYVMARAMDVLGENPFKTIDGKDHDWAAELGAQILKVDKGGHWLNDNPGWFESDKVLVTSYVLNALNCVCRSIK